jgi:hypothetical protein
VCPALRSTQSRTASQQYRLLALPIRLAFGVAPGGPPRPCSNSGLRRSHFVRLLNVVYDKAIPMGLLRTLRNVLANLRDGAEPTAVRTDQHGRPSSDYLERMAAVEATETYIASLGAGIPDPLRDELKRSVVHLQSPLLDPTALAEHVEACRYALSADINRGGLPESPEDALRLARYAALRQCLERLAAERAAER